MPRRLQWSTFVPRALVLRRRIGLWPHRSMAMHMLHVQRESHRCRTRSTQLAFSAPHDDRNSNLVFRMFKLRAALYRSCCKMRRTEKKERKREAKAECCYCCCRNTRARELVERGERATRDRALSGARWKRRRWKRRSRAADGGKRATGKAGRRKWQEQSTSASQQFVLLRLRVGRAD